MPLGYRINCIYFKKKHKIDSTLLDYYTERYYEGFSDDASRQKVGFPLAGTTLSIHIHARYKLQDVCDFLFTKTEQKQFSMWPDDICEKPHNLNWDVNNLIYHIPTKTWYNTADMLLAAIMTLTNLGINVEFIKG